MSRLRYSVIVVAVSLNIAVPATAQMTVFDPSNYAQNVLQASRALDQINNQITSLQKEAQMLANQARNLTSLPYSALKDLQSSFQRTQQLLGQAQRIAYDVNQIDQAFQTSYGTIPTGLSDQALIDGARDRWQTSVAGFEDALKVQASVVGNLDTSRVQMEALVTSSQSATGALQAAQAGNQILAVQSQQIADLTAAVAAQSRAQALEAARKAEAEAQGQEQLRRFMSTQGYQRQPVQAFHE